MYRPKKRAELYPQIVESNQKKKTPYSRDSWIESLLRGKMVAPKNVLKGKASSRLKALSYGKTHKNFKPRRKEGHSLKSGEKKKGVIRSRQMHPTKKSGKEEALARKKRLKIRMQEDQKGRRSNVRLPEDVC